MMRRHVLPTLACSLLLTASVFAQDSPYARTVKALQPTYYYQLNETDTSMGAVDSMGVGPTGEYNGDYDSGGPEVGIPGPDFLFEGGQWSFDALEWEDIGIEVDIVGLGANNVAHASNNQGHITLGDASDRDAFGANAMTVSMFALGGPADGGDRLFTNNLSDPLTSFQIVVGNDGIVVSTNPTLECPNEIDCGHRSLFFPEQGVPNTNSGADRGLNSADNGWWHIVASTSGDTAAERTENIRLFLNGVDRTADMLPGTTGWGINEEPAKIGGRRADPSDSTTHSGAQDEVAIWLDRVLTNEESLLLYGVAVGEATPPAASGDYNLDGLVTVADIDLQSAEMKSATPNLGVFDENNDGAVTLADRLIWVEQHAKTWVGDSNFDGEFNSTDFVFVFTSGKYESGAMATWGEGDWNGDMVFDSSDFVAAFSSGGYEIGPRAAVSAVPEPSSVALLLMGMLPFIRRRK